MARIRSKKIKRFHGSFTSKQRAVRKEKSKACHGQCFILERIVRGVKRFVVAERR